MNNNVPVKIIYYFIFKIFKIIWINFIFKIIFVLVIILLFIYLSCVFVYACVAEKLRE